jgi:outer membrane protein assembly factor BamB
VAHKNAFTNQTGTIGDGRVFVFGTMGIIRALDAKSGSELWTTAIPGYHEQMRKESDGGIYKPRSRAYCHGLNLVGGVVIAPMGFSDSKMVGINAKTGKVL